MPNTTLTHYGVLGMHWGQIRSKIQARKERVYQKDKNAADATREFTRKIIEGEIDFKRGGKKFNEAKFRAKLEKRHKKYLNMTVDTIRKERRKQIAIGAALTAVFIANLALQSH